MSRKTKIVAAVVALTIVGAVVAALAIGVNSPAADVDTAAAVQEDLAVTITAAGRVESGVRADVFPPTAAVIESVQVSDGQRVARGTVLATLDTEPLALQVEQARAGVAQAESGMAAVSRQEPTSAELESARRATAAAWQQYQAALAGANAVGNQAPSSIDRAAAAAAADAAYKAYLVAKGAYDLLKTQYNMFPDPSLEATLTQAEIAKDQAYAGYLQLKAAQDKLSSYDGSAPASQARAGSDQAYAGYLAARAQQGRLEGTNLSPERRAAQAAVDQARGALVLAQGNLDTAALISPVDGIVFFNAIGTPAADGQIPKAAVGAAIAPQSA
ncbi:MAG: biotin/lipoyl-binding protein, partial [Coriobacteriia bacterium]|nr:biotin/lipoyl-binding protein [Coriobacteriia bacterium]